MDISERMPERVTIGYTLRGPGTGTVGVASSNFTVTLTQAGRATTGTVTVTPDAISGAFTPNTVGLTAAAPSATFTYTAGSIGPKTITTTNNGGLINPPYLTYVAT